MVDTEYFLFAILYGLVGTSWGLWSLHMAETWHHRSILRSRSLNAVYFVNFPLSFLTGVVTPAHLLIRPPSLIREWSFLRIVGRISYLVWMAVFFPIRVIWNLAGILLVTLVSGVRMLSRGNRYLRQKQSGFLLPRRRTS